MIGNLVSVGTHLEKRNPLDVVISLSFAAIGLAEILGAW